MKKNTQLHLVVETDLFFSLKKQALEDGVSISEFCRQKLRECSKLNRIEILVEDLIKKFDNRKIYKLHHIRHSNINK